MPRIPRLSSKWKVHLKAGSSALLCSLVFAVESRDLYEKGQWEVLPRSPSKFQTGDIVLISNRWYALPTVKEKFYSLCSKLIMKSTWDDVGAIVKIRHTPYIIHAGYDKVDLVPLSEFVDERIPRGLAVRSLEATHPNSPLLNLRESLEGAEKVDRIVADLQQRGTSPWSLLTAGWLSNYERKHFAQATALCQQDEKCHRMKREQHTKLGMEKEITYLRDLKIVEEDLRSRVHFSAPSETVTHGSLVAEFLAELGFLMAPLPRLSKYLPCDYTLGIPTLDSRLGAPRVFYRM